MLKRNVRLNNVLPLKWREVIKDGGLNRGFTVVLY